MGKTDKLYRSAPKKTHVSIVQNRIRYVLLQNPVLWGFMTEGIRKGLLDRARGEENSDKLKL